ncbi:adenosylcobinamide-phosphate synthase CbiB [Candidatus Synechococcus calcipolaris G9]|uniref:Cobalamin biosynthesis protein CobD n=1 Tax=Candidatus Synechococcus calcipolaris G9 TaxID=1497997 RepID=A0ABT6EXQ5_9SYNE|nr:adenosylcobinamide-phosphate synthase CbiB [Candidatus Synechococcus calcipolaris]MDG2990527.1 adenosylcobinamide-phosphate synthase CbiB [Candidatus Synechococcus calcipolaris G9]
MLESWLYSSSSQRVFLVILAASALDFLVGDPWGWPHPVRLMGWLIDRYQGMIFSWSLPRWGLRLAGAVLTLGLILGSGGLTWFLFHWLDRDATVLGLLFQVILLASCFAGRSLRQAAQEVLAPLQQGHIGQARSALRHYVGRETDTLDPPEILRAILETVTENATDGVFAPLFYASLGILFPEIGPVPFALGYKAASTLDSMIGYYQAPFTDLGWFAAKTEDGLTWLPCRILVLGIALLSGQFRRVWAVCQRDAPKDPSPNAGWSECAYAATLGVQMGGMNTYGGLIKVKPLLGDGHQPITATTIAQALSLTRRVYLLYLLLCLTTVILIYGL